MQQEKVVVFLDYANVNRAARGKGYRLDYHHLLQYVGEHRFLVDAHCYVPINPRNEHRLDREIEELWRSGYIVNTKVGSIAGGTYKCNFDVEITMDILTVVYQVKPDIIVVASGDSDFVPLIQEVRKSGVRVEVAAFAENAGPDIQLKCSGFIDLAVYYESYLAAQDEGRHGDGVEERFRDLIQAQNDGEVGDGLEEQLEELIQSREDELDEDTVKVPLDELRDKTVKVPVDELRDKTGDAVADIIDGLDV